MPFQVDRTVKISRAMDLGPAMRTARLFCPHFDEVEFLLQQRIAHDLGAERSLSGSNDLKKSLQLSLGCCQNRFLQWIVSEIHSISGSTSRFRNSKSESRISNLESRISNLETKLNHQIFKTHRLALNETQFEFREFELVSDVELRICYSCRNIT